MEVVGQLVPDRPCLPRAAYTIGMPWRPWRFLLICRVVANGLDRVSLEREGTVLWCGSRGPNLEGVLSRAVGQKSEKKNLP